VELVWRLDLATLRWEAMPALVDARSNHACCAVRNNLVVIGGATSFSEDASLGSVEMLAEGEGAFTGQPPLTCGRIAGAVAIVVNESGSAAGQVLLLGGYGEDGESASMVVFLVDLATGPRNQVSFASAVSSRQRGCLTDASFALEVSFSMIRDCRG